MDIKILLRDDSPEDQSFLPTSYQIQATTNNAGPSLSAHTDLHSPDLSHSQSDNLRDQVQSSQKGLASSLLNSNPPLDPRTMDDVSQDIYADVDPEVMEAAEILVMMSNGWDEEGANNKRCEESAFQEGHSSHSTIPASSKSPVGHCFEHTGSIGHNSFYQQPSLQFPVNGHSTNSRLEFLSEQSNQRQRM